ncbi:hypothetical protein NM688_g8514 [Phlebia brevispora]|uniref:Uncharacterized protein n=1 Tax=Phlebia brevispora TaxID=194682 RepID=A0ACC1RT88_9APHY|nr:hypothetical protein NM688_g8514 [Phlebia brevispora]
MVASLLYPSANPETFIELDSEGKEVAHTEEEKINEVANLHAQEACRAALDKWTAGNTQEDPVVLSDEETSNSSTKTTRDLRVVVWLQNGLISTFERGVPATFAMRDLKRAYSMIDERAEPGPISCFYLDTAKREWVSQSPDQPIKLPSWQFGVLLRTSSAVPPVEELSDEVFRCVTGRHISRFLIDFHRPPISVFLIEPLLIPLEKSEFACSCRLSENEHMADRPMPHLPAFDFPKRYNLRARDGHMRQLLEAHKLMSRKKPTHPSTHSFATGENLKKRQDRPGCHPDPDHAALLAARKPAKRLRLTAQPSNEGAESRGSRIIKTEKLYRNTIMSPVPGLDPLRDASGVRDEKELIDWVEHYIEHLRSNGQCERVDRFYGKIGIACERLAEKALEMKKSGSQSRFHSFKRCMGLLWQTRELCQCGGITAWDEAARQGRLISQGRLLHPEKFKEIFGFW